MPALPSLPHNVAPTPPALDTTPPVDREAARRHLVDVIASTAMALRALDRDVDSNRYRIADSHAGDAERFLAGFREAVAPAARRTARGGRD